MKQATKLSLLSANITWHVWLVPGLDNEAVQHAGTCPPSKTKLTTITR